MSLLKLYALFFNQIMIPGHQLAASFESMFPESTRIFKSLSERNFMTESGSFTPPIPDEVHSGGRLSDEQIEQLERLGVTTWP
jgi:hypothetical protein